MRKVWTDEMIETGIRESIETLMINRMPTAEELKQIGRNDLHIKVSRTLKYSGWAERLNLPLKSCDTRKGQAFESFIEELLASKGHSVERMTTKHPYDLFVDGCVKIDVKMSKPGTVNKCRVHTFGINKKDPTCDIYICVAVNEHDEAERIFVIPSHKLRVVTLCVGSKSKYDMYIDAWDSIKRYSEFMQS